MYIKTLQLLSSSCLTAVLLALPGAAGANPVGGTVSAGNATITNNGSRVDIQQNSNRAVIDWHSFDIGAGEATQFHQPSSNAAVLNRVGGSGTSQIDGELIANGNVFIVNPNGVVFGKGSRVDVNGLVATTADVKNSDFMKGNYKFSTPGNPNASIVNEGTITAKEAGLVGLVAPNVSNSGVITAKAGRIHLASGDTATVDLYGDGLMEVAVSDQVKSQLVENKGILAADGGTVALTAAAGRQVVDSVVHVSGTLQANSISQKNGKIILSAAGNHAQLKIDGNIDASGKAAGAKGGSVDALAENITVTTSAVIDASGDAGGGAVRIGGDLHGQGTSIVAQYTDVAQGATVKANAITKGNGGKVVIWADKDTKFAGTISAKSGAQGGKGGFVETSGKENLTATGHVDLSALANADYGTWLLDPTNITIYNRSQGGTDNTNSFTTAYLESQSTSANVALSATNNITLDMTGDTMNFSTAGRSLTLSAGNQILTNSAGTIQTNNAAINLTGTNGILFTNAIALNPGGNIVTLATTNSPVSFSNALTMLGNTVITAGTGAVTFGGTVNGNYIMNAAGGLFTFGGAWGGTTGLANTAITSSQPITLPAITTQAGKTVSILENGNGNAVTVGGAISTGAGGSIGITADDLIINANLSGTGTITLKPFSNRNVCLNSTGSGLCSSNVFDLSTAEIGHLVDGWTSVVIGSATNTANMDIGANGALTFTDPVTFLNNSRISIDGNLTATGNGAFTFDSGTTNGYTNLSSASITTNGGNINFNSLKNYVNVNTTVTSNNGNVAFTGSIDGGSATAAELLTIAAGTGSINLGTRVDSGAGFLLSLVASGASITSGAMGAFGAVGNVTLTAVNSLTLPAITTFSNRTVSATVTGAGNSITANGAISTSTGGNITLQADDLAINSNLSGTGTLTLQQQNDSRPVDINWTGTNDFNISTAEIAKLVDGWTSILIGRTTGTTYTNIGASTWTDPVMFRNNFIDRIYGALTGTGNASLSFTPNTEISYPVTTNGQLIRFYNALVVTGVSGTNEILNSNGGNIMIGSQIQAPAWYTSGPVYMTLNAGSGAVSYGAVNNQMTSNPFNFTVNGGSITSGTIGATGTAMGTVSLTSASDLTLPTINATNLYITDVGHTILQTGAFTITGGLDLEGSGSTYTLTNTSNDVATIAGNSGTINYFNKNGTITNIGTVNGTNGLTATNLGLGTNGGMTQSKAVTATNMLLSGGGYVVLTNIANNVGTLAATIASFSLVNGNNSLTIGSVSGVNGLTDSSGATINTGTGTLTVNQAISAATLSLKADNMGFNAGVAGTSGLTLLASTNNRPIDINYASEDGTNLNLSATDLSRISGFNQITVGNSTFAGLINLGDVTTGISSKMISTAGINAYGSLTSTGTAGFTIDGVSTAGFNMYNNGNITTAGGIIDAHTANYFYFAGSHTLASNGGNIWMPGTTSTSGVALTFDAGSGNVTTTGGISGPEDLTIKGATISLGGNLGNNDLGNVTITSANNLSLTNIKTANGKTVTANATNAGAKLTSNIISTGTNGNIMLSADDLAIVGALSGTGTLTLQPYATTRNININRNSDDGTGLYLSSAELSNLTNGWGNINIGRADSSSSSIIYIGGSNWVDPVTFRNGAPTMYMDGAVVGTDNAAFTFQGSTYFRNGSITTSGGNVALNSNVTFEQAGTITTNGGSVSVGNLFRLTNTNATNINVTTNGGNISIANSVTELADSTGRTVTLDAGYGTLSFGNTVNGRYNLIANAATILTNGVWGGVQALGNVTLTAINDLTLPSLTTVAGKTVNVTLTGAGKQITAGAIATGAGGNITLTADDLVLNGDLSGTGALTLAPYSSGRAVDVNYAGTNDLSLSAAELAHLVDGWAGITVGSGTGGTVTLGTTSWVDPITFLSNSTIQIAGDITGTGNASFTFGAGVTGHRVIAFGSAITTAGGAISMNDQLQVFNNATYTSNGGTIALGSITNYNGSNDKTLTLNTGSGSISTGTVDSTGTNGNFGLTASGNSITTGVMGGTQGVGNISLTSIASLVMPSITTAAGKTVAATVTGVGNSITTGAIATGVGGNITLTADDVAINGDLSGTGTLTLQPKTNGRSVAVNYGADDGSYFYLDTNELTHLVNGWSLINIGSGNVSAGDMHLGAATWNDSVTFYGNGKTLEGNQVLTGAGSNFVSSQNAFDMQGRSITTAGGSVTLMNHFDPNGGTITTNGGDFVQNTGGMRLGSGGGLTVNTAGGDASFNDITDSSSAAGKLLSVNTGTGSAAFNGVNTAANVTVTSGSIVFNHAWGDSTPLGTISLTSANSLSLPSITASSILANATGASADIILNSGTVLHSTGTGNALTLVANRNFVNNAGANALSSTGGGRWLVYSTNPDDSTGEGSLASDFNRYSCEFSSAGACQVNGTLGRAVVIPTSGNGLVYSYTPLLTATPDSIADITYGDAGPNVTNYTYTLTGYRAGEGADTITGNLTGATNYTQGSNVGTYGISYTGGDIFSALGYDIHYANNMSAFQVTPRALTVITDSKSKIQGDPNPAFTGSNNLWSGDVGLISWSYAPFGYGGGAGSYSIRATANDPSHRLANYTRVNSYGTFTVNASTPTPPPTIPTMPDIPNSVLRNPQVISVIPTTFWQDTQTQPISGPQAIYSYLPAAANSPFAPQRIAITASPELLQEFGVDAFYL